MSYRDIVRDQLRQDEGIRAKPYKDSVGKLTIGIGRNLDDVGLSPYEINILLESDLIRAEDAAMKCFDNFASLSDARKAVLMNMAFNLGQPRLSEFKKLKSAVEANDWDWAAKEMLSSKWSEQVGMRAQRLAKAMREG
jgi:lysozyme